MDYRELARRAVERYRELYGDDEPPDIPPLPKFVWSPTPDFEHFELIFMNAVVVGLVAKIAYTDKWSAKLCYRDLAHVGVFPSSIQAQAAVQIALAKYDPLKFQTESKARVA